MATFVFRIFVSLLTLFVFALTNLACNSKPKQAFVVVHLDSTIRATKVSISELAENYRAFQGRYVETTGKFHQAFEEFAIYTDNRLPNGALEGFWLGTDKDLSIDNSYLDRMNGKRVTIKGLVDTTHKGHLSSYLATIDKIYFWQEQ
ncbi:hypothetical protein [Flavihumibacter petaseus]|uniref:Uncharacterized protein n=1 Tax=Flavihumibacter petaseus NBRC 106054 TaxID=1220578 RepID=A0A0E9MW84_9BACT|nr:hypothetical protein [Flavihumibacter petaseus]GAO41768.1 hypothetical protein FPE01S_01_07820 [Flavihumibacter petaseus NBRC 106054]